MSKLLFKESAERDLTETLTYIAKSLKNPIAAKSVHQEIIKAIDNICLFPKSAPIFNPNEQNQYEIRKQIAKNFYIFYVYEEETDTIKVLFIKYVARNFDGSSLSE